MTAHNAKPATPLPWTPSTHHRAPQPAGKQCADWYQAVRPEPVDILYALAHTKGERDELITALRKVLNMHCQQTGFYQDRIEAMPEARALLAKLGEG